ncbi:MAG TPA: hypothetical protein VKX39_18445 [Bryobacteraceae bacterium]|jgi:hypothetical protein|nr:hypothetical protein [Bryobacteraceae bacterium]
MDIIKMLSELRTEREQIEGAIIVLERLAHGHGKRRGRPPAWMSATKSKKPSTTNDETPKKRAVSPEARARMAQAQRKRWAAKRAEAAS